MKKFLLQLIINNAYAQSTIPCPDGTTADPSLGCVPVPGNVVNPESPLVHLIFQIAHYLTLAAGSLAIIFIIYGGIRYALAAGNDEKIQQAKSMLFWSIFGLVLSLLAFGLVQFFSNVIS